jgi:hypothetical protein
MELCREVDKSFEAVMLSDTGEENEQVRSVKDPMKKTVTERSFRHTFTSHDIGLGTIALDKDA